MEYDYFLKQAYKISEELIESPDFQELKALKMEIDLKLSPLIKDFKAKEAAYDEAKKYGAYHPDLGKYALAFSEAKQRLYEEDLVIKYKALEKKLQEKLNLISEKIMESI